MSTEHLSDLQIARIEALEAAQPLIGRSTRGPFSGGEPTDLNDLVDLSEYILEGKHPMERYDGLEPQFSAELIGGEIGDTKEVSGDDTPDA